MTRPCTAQNPIAAENQLPGTLDWQLAQPAATRLRCPADSSCAATPQGEPEIEGYASATSVGHGENISFFVNTADPTYTLAIYRIGWYGGSGGRLVLPPIRRAGTRQPIPPPDPLTGLVECEWSDPFIVTIPADWTTGVYLVVLTAGISQSQSYIHFVVRDDTRDADFLFQCSVATYQAYNCGGGKSLYDWHSTGCVPAYKVSFDRPYAYSSGAGEFFFWEINLVRWLEREGYDVAYCTNVDVHERAGLLRRHKAFFSVGHDEYWSGDMRIQVEAARDSGVHLAFLTASACYWQVRFEPSVHGGAPNRTLVAYKHDALNDDPYATDADPANDREVTVRWREWPVLRPEAALIGVMYEPAFNMKPPSDQDVIVTHPEHWIFAGTGIDHGGALLGLLGNEMDRIFPSSPRRVSPIAQSPVSVNGLVVGISDMTVYHAPSHAIVFAAGTQQWSWGLDSFVGYFRQTPRESEVVKQATRNLLAEFTKLSKLGVGSEPFLERLFAWPIPFGPRSGPLTIRIISERAARGAVTIHDLQGRRIARLVLSGEGPSAVCQWDGTDGAGRQVSAGVYLVRCGRMWTRVPVVD
jgi:hypothetical protein